MRHTAADIIARSRRGNNKKIRDEVDGKNEKNRVENIDQGKIYLVDIDRPSNVGTSSFNVSRRFNFQLRIERIESNFFNDFQRFVSTRCRVNVNGSLARSEMARSNNKWLGKHLTAARKYVPGENVLFQSSRVGRIKAERKVFNARSPT